MSARSRYEAALRSPPLDNGVRDPENVQPTFGTRISAGWHPETYQHAYARGYERGHADGWGDGLRLVWKMFPELRERIKELAHRRPFRGAA